MGSNKPGRERNPPLRRFQIDVAVEAYAGGAVRVRVDESENPFTGRNRGVKIVERLNRDYSGVHVYVEALPVFTNVWNC